MTTILIVDDSEVDLRIATGLLEGTQDYQFRFAANGAEALAQIELELPDIVLTDLMMPKMDGLELVSKLREEYPLVPVILMTAKGNEEIATEALQRGAASYVPKRLSNRYLARTVGHLLDAARERRSRAKLLGTMRTNQCVFSLTNDIELVPTLVGYFQEGMSHLGLGDETDRLRVSVALEEALSNAIHHGNLEVSSELREQNDNAYYDLIRQRQKELPYSNRGVEITVKMSDQEAKFVICDEGPGFDVSSLPDPTDPENLEKASGRGVTLMKAFMDEVTFNDAGNAVTLIKRSSYQRDENDLQRIFRNECSGEILIVSVLRNVTSLSDESLAQELGDILKLLSETEVRHVVVDLQNVSRFGSSFLECLRRIWKAVNREQGKFALCNVSELGREILEISRFDELWPVVATCDEAITAVNQSAVDL